MKFILTFLVITVGAIAKTIIPNEHHYDWGFLVGMIVDTILFGG